MMKMKNLVTIMFVLSSVLSLAGQTKTPKTTSKPETKQNAEQVKSNQSNIIPTSENTDEANKILLAELQTAKNKLFECADNYFNQL